MNKEVHSLNYGKRSIPYNLFYAKRKTLEIAVHPDGSVLIKAPVGASLETISRKLQKRARWILKQRNFQ